VTIAAGGIHFAKLSLHEFEQFVGSSLTKPGELEEAAMDVVRSARLELLAVTMGHEGAFLAQESGTLRLPALKADVRSAGAGFSAPSLERRWPRPSTARSLMALFGLVMIVVGIGGGFLIMPGLMLATDMPLTLAIGTSLVAVAASGAATAGSYAVSGLVDWWLAGLFVVGGLLGGVAGAALGKVLASRKQVLGKGPGSAH
jgi:hypothetical protein